MALGANYTVRFWMFFKTFFALFRLRRGKAGVREGPAPQQATAERGKTWTQPQSILHQPILYHRFLK